MKVYKYFLNKKLYALTSNKNLSDNFKFIRNKKKFNFVIDKVDDIEDYITLANINREHVLETYNLHDVVYRNNKPPVVKELPIAMTEEEITNITEFTGMVRVFQDLEIDFRILYNANVCFNKKLCKALQVLEIHEVLPMLSLKYPDVSGVVEFNTYELFLAYYGCIL